jgi:hypothetical protein
MSHLEILLPFGQPPAEMAADLLKALKAPSLATLIARNSSLRHRTFDAFSRTLPHETWLACQFGLANRPPLDTSPPVASAVMHRFGLTAQPGVWFLLNPVHLHIARDHLVLTSQRQLALPDQESRALFQAAQPLFDEAGHSALYGDARTWFLHGAGWADLQTATPDAACGHNIDIWMPHGPGEREWRKLQNEVQMVWHAHAVNAQRQERGLKPVNSLWLWGGTGGMQTPQGDFRQDVAPARYDGVFNLPGWIDGCGRSATGSIQDCTASGIIAAAPKHGLLVLDDLIEPALGGDWSEWLVRFQALDAAWFSPLLDALKGSKIDHVSLIITHGTQLSEFTSSKHSLRKFWVKPSLAKLTQ